MVYGRTILAGIAFALSSLAVNAAEIETARGPVTIKETPRKIAVFDVAAIDTLDRLGVKLAGVPKKLYVPELEHLKSGAEMIGDIFEPDLESLSALGPDLVIVGSRSSAKIAAIEQIAQTIDMTMDGDDLVEQAKARLSAYGVLFDRGEEAAAAVRELDDAVNAVQAAVAGKGNGLIVMTNGPKVSAYGPGSRFGWIHAALRLPPAVATIEAATHGEAVSFEFIREANPDWLLVLDRAAAVGSGEQNARATLDNELITQTSAWKKGRVVYLPAADLYISAGGVQSMQHVMAVIQEAFTAVP